MARYPENKWSIDRSGPNQARITVRGFEPTTGAPMSMRSDFNQDKVREFVTSLCSAAGLPRPWQRS